jgi:protoheme IX farnesyltransferase
MYLTSENSTRSTAVASDGSIGIMPVGGGTVPAHGAARPAPTAALRVRAHDFLSLTKPRVLVLVLIATGLGWVMAAAALDVGVLVHALLGTALVAGGTAALNQYSERAYDARMRRTARRPLPSGRLQPQEVLWFGLGLSLAGTVYLAVTLNLLTSLVGLAALLSYLLLYTPLKRRSRLCTLVGACPGAAPVLIGWVAVRGDLTPAAWVLYAILFLWQFPHFLAIGWLYREDYARAGMRMIPAGDDSGRATFGLIQLTAWALVAVSVLPPLLGMAGMVYLGAALLLGGRLLYVVSQAASERSEVAARQLLRATVLYLPLLCLCLGLFRTAPVAGWPF